MRLSVSTSSGVVKRTAPAMVWRWRKVCASGSLSSGLACAGRHLDVEAQDVVVPHFQRLDAGLLEVLGLQRRHHLAAVVAQAAGLVEIGAEAWRARSRRRGADAAARRPARGRAGLRARCRIPSGAGRCRRAPPAGRCRRRPRAAGARTRRPSPDRRARRRGRAGPPRCRARREMARAMSGAARSVRAQVARAASRSRAGSRPHRDARRSRSGSRSGLDSRAASSRAPGPVDRAVDGGEQAALPLARERAQQLQARAARARR